MDKNLIYTTICKILALLGIFLGRKRLIKQYKENSKRFALQVIIGISTGMLLMVIIAVLMMCFIE